MSRSRKKIAGTTWCTCKSRKKGKQMCHRKFRRCGKFFKMIEAMDSWDLGGDGKQVVTWDKKSELFKKYTKK